MYLFHHTVNIALDRLIVNNYLLFIDKLLLTNNKVSIRSAVYSVD
jgi:hypothetical protein